MQIYSTVGSSKAIWSSKFKWVKLTNCASFCRNTYNKRFTGTKICAEDDTECRMKIVCRLVTTVWGEECACDALRSLASGSSRNLQVVL